MPASFPAINWLAVLVATVVAFGLGALWYSPVLFGKPWMRANAYTPETLEAMRRGGAAKSYGGTFVAQLVTAVVLAVLIGWTGAWTVIAGAKVAALAWLGFTATSGLINNLYSPRPFAAYAIDAGYHLVYTVIMGAIIGAWR